MTPNDGGTEEMSRTGFVLQEQPVYRCDRGHQPTNKLIVNDGHGNSVEVCIRCVMELVAQHCGKVERVSP